MKNYYSIYSNLKNGDRGNQVKGLQMSLPSWCSSSPIVADGIFGSATESAVKRFQSELNFVDDGIVGELTGTALGAWVKLEQGIDCSHYQKVNYVQFQTENPEYTFAIIKATEGKDYQDPSFASHCMGFNRIGVNLSAYHFTKFNNQPTDEAVNFCSTILKSGVVFNDLFLDLEYRETDLDNLELIFWIFCFLDTVKAFMQSRIIGKIGVYTSDRYLKEMNLQRQVWMKDYLLWASDLNDQPLVFPWDSWDIWQHSFKGQLVGIEGDVDLNYRRITQEG